MYELIQLSKKCFFMDCPAKVGFYLTGDKTAVLIDAGSDKDAGKKAKRLLDAQGWQLQAVFNTHSHADHTGGNQYLQSQTGCRIYAPGAEQAVAAHPFLEPLVLYGGLPLPELQNKFLMAKESSVEALTEEVLPAGLTLLPLPGHSYDMIGFRTDEDIVFLADCLSSAETLEKYQISFLYDVKTYLETLEKVKNMQAALFVPAHAAVTEDIAPLAQLNIDKTAEVADRICSLLTEPKLFEDLLADVFTDFGLSMNIGQRVLVGSTVKSYLTYLKQQGRADYCFENNRMLWRRS